MKVVTGHIAAHFSKALPNTGRIPAIRRLMLVAVLFVFGTGATWGQICTITEIHTDVRCHGQSTGLIDITVGNGTAPYTFAWTGPNSFSSTNEDISGLEAGVYSVTVSGSNGSCSGTSTIDIVQPLPLNAGAHNITSLIVCENYDPATLSLSPLPSEGTAPYSYQWYENLSPEGTDQPSYDPGNLTIPGSYEYYCIVTDDCNQTAETIHKLITVEGDPTITISDIGNVCQGDVQPTLSTSIVGGAGTYTYLWYSGPSITGPWTEITGEISSAYSPSTSTSGTFYYRVSLISNGAACNNSWDAVQLIVDPLPTASASGSQTICVNGTATVSGASASNGTILWTENGAGSITAGENTLTPTYTPAAGDAGNTVTLTMTVTSNNNCGTASATATYAVSVDPLPTASAGGSQTICVNGTATVSGTSYSNGTILWTENGAGSITAGGTTLTPTYTPAAGDAGNTITLTMTVTSNNNCGTTSATATYAVIVDPLPTAFAGGSQTICINGTSTVSGASASNGTILWTENGAGSITAGGTTLTPTYTPAAGDAGNTITLTMTVTSNNNCGTASATATYAISVDPLPTASAGGSQTICVNGTATVSGASASNGTILWTENGAGSITAGGTTLTPTYTPAAGDAGNTVTLTMTVTSNNNCGTASATATYAVSVDPLPTASAGGSQTICVNGTATVSGTSYSNGTILWTENGAGSITVGGTTLTPTYTPAAGDAGNTVTLTMTVTSNNNCGTASATATYAVSVDPLPTASAGGSQTICVNGTATVSGTSYSNGTILWTENGAGSITAGGTTLTPTYTPAASDAGNTVTLTMTVTSNNNCGIASATATYAIIINPVPIVNQPSNQTVCNGVSTTTVNFIGTGTLYSWTNDNTTVGLAADGTGNITPFTAINTGNSSIIANITVTPIYSGGGADCLGTSQSFAIIVDPRPAISNMTATICSGGSFTVTPADGGGNIVPAGTTYSWSSPAGSRFTGGAPGVSQPNIFGTLTNTSNTPTTATYNVTPTAPGGSVGCSGLAFTVTVTINPAPTITNMSATICSGGSFTVTPVNSINGLVPAGTTYSWDAPSVTGGMTGGAAGSGAANINGTLSNPTNTPQTATYTVTPQSGTCAGTNFTVTVTVDPRPAISNMTATICSGGSFTVTPADGGGNIVPAGTTYSWSSPAGSRFTGGAPGVSQPNIFGTLTNTSNTPTTATYNVTPTAPGGSVGCSGLAFTVTVTINPAPTITNMSATICSGGSFTVTPVNSINGLVPAGTTYSWDAPSVTGGMTGGAAGSGAANINGTLSNPTNTPQTATYTVTPQSGTCAGTNFTVTVTVDPRPAISNMTATICSGGSFTVTPADGGGNIVPAGTTYSWSSPAGSRFTGGAPGVSQPNIFGTLTNTSNTPTTATYNVTPTAPGGSVGCSGLAFTVTVTINPAPTITNMSATICSGGSFTVTPVNSINGLVPAGTTYSWDAPSVTGGMTGGAAGSGAANINGTLSNPTNTPQTATYTVTPQSGTCAGTNFTVTVTVDPRPAISNMTATICSGGSFTVTPADGGGNIVPAGTTYSWSSPAGSRFTGGAPGVSQPNIFGTLTNTSNTPTTATYNVTPTAPGGSVGCSGLAFTVTVTINPAPAINDMSATICSGGSFTVTPVNSINGLVPAGTTYSWDAPSVTGGMTGGAAGSGAANINGTLSNPTNTPQTATYTVTPQSGTCAGTNFTVTVTVDPRPAISNMTATICSGGSFTVTPADGGGNIVPAGTTYSWSSPAGSRFTGGAPGVSQPNIFGTLTNTSNTPTTATYNVTPTAPGGSVGCSGLAFTVTVTINPAPTITNMSATICSGGSFTVTPVNSINGLVPAGTTYSWDAPSVTGGMTGGAAGSGAANINGTLSNPTNTPQTATYTVTPQSGTCAGTNFTVTVTVDPRPAISNMTATICSGGSFTVTPADGGGNIVPAGTTYSWSSPAGSRFTGGAPGVSQPNIFGTLTNTSNTPTTATYNVTPTAPGGSVGCSGLAFTVTVTINPAPTITNMSATICSGGSFTVTPVNSINGLVPAGTTYSWDAPSVTGGMTGGAAGSGAANINGTLSNPTNTPQTATYTVTPQSGTCAGTNFTVTVTVDPRPAISNMTATICSGGSFTVTPADGGGNIVPAGTTYSWSSPAGSRFTGGAPGVSQPNIFGTLTNTSNTPTTATYNVTPTAPGGSVGCSGSTFTVTVTINPAPAINDMSATICSGSTFIVTPVNSTNGIVPAGTTYSWPAPGGSGFTGGAASSGNPTSINGTLINTTNAPVTATYTITPTAPDGSLDCSGPTFTVTVIVNPLPTATISGPTPVCLNSTGNVYTTQAGQSNYIWTIVGGTITAGGEATDYTATVTWTTSGTQSISVNYTDANGCTAASPTTQNVTVTPLTIPTVSISITPGNNICSGTEVTFNANVGNAGTNPIYEWLLNGTTVVGTWYHIQ